MPSFKIMRGAYIFITALFLVPFFALAINDVTVSDDTSFELDTADTATLTTIVASAGGQITNFDVESNYIDITLDNLSSIIFTTTVGGQYLKITKQSGSDDYTLNPTCPTNTVTMTGTGATVILRLEVVTTDSCTVTPPSSGGGGGSTPANGSCGTANNGAFHYSIPTINLCSVGTASTIIGSGPWVWTCSGSHGGSVSPICTANKAFALPVGCSSTVGYSSTTGLPCSGIDLPVTPPVIPVTPVTPVTPPVIIPAVCNPYMTQYIKLGDVNDQAEVRKLQTFLRDYEGFAILAITGIYDQVTYEAVKVFQSRYTQDILTPWGHTAPTGYVYTTTIKKINEIYCQRTATIPVVTPILIPPVTPPVITPTACSPYLTQYIKLGEVNDFIEVKKLQTFLRDYEGFATLAITGIYDQVTYEAVKVFQSRYTQDILTPWGHTAPTGYVYTTTIKKINEIYCQRTATIVTTTSTTDTLVNTITPYTTTNNLGYQFTRDLELGMIGDDVKELQKFLNNNGYLIADNGPGSPDNETTMFGYATKAALIKYQLVNGITPAVGNFGPTTMAEINKSSASVGNFINFLITIGVIAPDRASLVKTILGL